MSRRLHEITGDFLALEELLIEAGGEFTPEVEALMAELHGSLETKVDGYAALIAEWLSDAEKWKAEEQRVAAHRKALENAADRMKTRLCEQMIAMDQLKVETPRFKVAVQRSASSVEVLCDAADLPAMWRREVPATVAPDKAAILADLKAGVNGESFARLTDGTAYVRIR